MTVNSVIEANLADDDLIPEWDLSDRLQKSLKVRRLSVGSMADAFGLSRETIGRWLSGKAEPDKGRLYFWSVLTGVNLHWLETGEWAPRGSNPEPAVSQHSAPDLRLWINPETVKPGLTPKLGSQDAGTRHLKAVS